MRKSISVVIPNYNGKDLLEKNLPFLYTALQTVQTDFEIIISDDCSTDESVSFLKTYYPSILLVENLFNQGFSGNINAGIRIASKELVFLLNTDIKLTPEYFLPLFSYFDQDSTFGVMGRIIALDSDKIQDTAKYPQYKNGNLKPTLNYLPKNSSNPSYLPTLFLSGANALVDRQKLLEVGCFQELFNPFYWEDVELGIKAWRLGYVCYYEHSAICRHPTSATIGKYNKKKKVALISRRNKILFHYLHLEGMTLLAWMSLYFFKALFRGLTFNGSYLKALGLFMRQYSKASKEKTIFKDKQKTQETASLSLKKVCQTIQAMIGEQPIERF
ncbi:MAG TPA: glycosyltransferase family 2 protein [Cytophagaceae bacterium]|nr:glycosyltransferase family 2 protein [Cytophagaceae bacterium]